MKKFFWIIEHYKSSKLKAQHVIPRGQITDENIKNLLKALTAKHNLTDEEMVPCFFKKNTKKYWDYLEVNFDPRARFHTLSTNGDVHFTALSIPEDKLSEVLEEKLK